jgi:inorganic pyrophosphatase
MNLYDIPIHEDSPNFCNVVVEIPKGSNEKYEYDPRGFFRYDRSLNTAMVYPANYGFIPNTMTEDGDPLDAVIYNFSPIQRGTVVEGRVLGVLDMTDDGEKDWKILVIPKCHIRKYNVLTDTPMSLLKIFKNFFAHYKDLDGKIVNMGDWHGKEKAFEIINNSIVK